MHLIYLVRTPTERENLRQRERKKHEATTDTIDSVRTDTGRLATNSSAQQAIKSISCSTHHRRLPIHSDLVASSKPREPSLSRFSGSGGVALGAVWGTLCIRRPWLKTINTLSSSCHFPQLPAPNLLIATLVILQRNTQTTTRWTN